MPGRRAVLVGTDMFQERQANVGLPDLGCLGSVPGSGGSWGRKIEEKGGSESQVKDKERPERRDAEYGDTRPSRVSVVLGAPRESLARGRPDGGTRDPPRPAGARPHRALARRRRQRGPPSPETELCRVLWPRAAAATGVDLTAQTPPATATRVPTPRPHLPPRERAPCRARHPAGSRERAPPGGGACLSERKSGFLVSMRSKAVGDPFLR